MSKTLVSHYFLCHDCLCSFNKQVVHNRMNRLLVFRFVRGVAEGKERSKSFFYSLK